MTEQDWRWMVRAATFREAAEVVSRTLGIDGAGRPRVTDDGIPIRSGLCTLSVCCPHCHDTDRRRLMELAEEAESHIEA